MYPSLHGDLMNGEERKKDELNSIHEVLMKNSKKEVLMKSFEEKKC